MYTRQSSFDKVVAHLRTQGHRAMLSEGETCVAQCAYRLPNGDRCAIGALMPDDQYSPEFEGKWVGVDILIRMPFLDGLRENDGSERFLAHMQQLHDNELNWTKDGINEECFARFAEKYELTVPPL